MTLKSKLLLAALATSSAAFAQTAPAAPESAIAYNVGVVSEYRYRGLAQTKGDPALQGGVDYTGANGFYAGAWASTIKWIKDSAAVGGTSTKGPVELDIYGGYKFEAAGLGFDVGYLRYEYLNNTLSNNTTNNMKNANTDEVYGAATYGVTTLKYSYAFSNLFGANNSKGSTYWDLSATFDLGNGFSLVPHAGHQKVVNNATSYTDIALTLNKDLGNGLSASVSAISTNAKGKGDFASYLTGYDVAKNTTVVGLKYSF
jgi:uncharacterized protein (TIGR02001 family)